ncbi:hypothetical protein GW17_00049346, partial [Ensete ventricosum]
VGLEARKPQELAQQPMSASRCLRLLHFLLPIRSASITSFPRRLCSICYYSCMLLDLYTPESSNDNDGNELNDRWEGDHHGYNLQSSKQLLPPHPHLAINLIEPLK